MARRLRIQYPGAVYHIINRGNYRADLFDTVGAAKAFEDILDEACRRFSWIVHAYVLMRNHFHLALETPQPNLVDGMHWLQSTYAARFNRLRKENGHLFQGRYQSLLIEDAAALARVVDYIHLNPVRANVLPADQLSSFRWSSLRRLRPENRPSWLMAGRWLSERGLQDDPSGWKQYIEGLTLTHKERNAEQDHAEFCSGWAIGTNAWRVAMARDHRHLNLIPGFSMDEARDAKQARWTEALEAELKQCGHRRESLREAAKGEPWKREIAAKLRREVGASHAWLAKHLAMGSPNSVRAWLNGRRAGIERISA